MFSPLSELQDCIIQCRLCPRLVAWREQVAREKVKRFSEDTYWGLPLPSFGDYQAQVMVVGLAPAAHGGNRTGRMFTGDRSGDWLYRALYNTGFANQPTSINRYDGLLLNNCYITAMVHCAPPDNKPLKEEVTSCHGYLVQELTLMPQLKVIVALGKLAFDATVSTLYEASHHCVETTKRPSFGHGLVYEFSQGVSLIGSYHPSQQNTFTGRLTEPMLDSVFTQAQTLVKSRL